MLTVKEDILDKISDWSEDYYILTDFDRTITAGDSESSWGVLAKSTKIPEGYIEDRQILFDYYRPIELNLGLDYEIRNKYMIEWWSKHISLFVKYKLKEKVITEAATTLQVMKFRKGAEEFLKKMHQKGIPVIIISAGIGNFVKEFLIQNNSLYDNIYIVSNFIKFENGVAVGISNEIIHALNKNTITLPDNVQKLINKKKNIVLLGDSIDDIQMVSDDIKDDCLKIGFLNESTESDFKIYQDNFDIVCDSDITYIDLMNKLDIFK